MSQELFNEPAKRKVLIKRYLWF